jgi:hypothetical protein
VQKELLGTYEEASRAWLARVQSEVDLWSGLAAKLTATRSVPEAVAAYQECVAQRMKMAAEDGQRLADECQKGMNKISRALSNGWPTEVAETRSRSCKSAAVIYIRAMSQQTNGKEMEDVMERARKNEEVP